MSFEKKIVGFYGELLLIVTLNSKNVKGQKFVKKIVGFLRKLLLIVHHDLQLISNDTLNSKNIKGQKFVKKNRWLFEKIAFDSS